MITVVCLKVGKLYGPAYVNRLASACRDRLLVEHDFACFTDDPDGLEFGRKGQQYSGWLTLSDPHLTGWWHKLSLFRPDGAFGQIKGRILYLDLDVIVTGPLDDLVNYPSEFAMHQDFQRPWQCASAVMVMEAGSRGWIWDAFVRDQGAYIRRFHGDQDFLRTSMEENTRWPALHNGEHCDFFPQRWIRSYKIHAQQGPPPDCRVVAFHGTPKPHEIESGWVKDAWK